MGSGGDGAGALANGDNPVRQTFPAEPSGKAVAIGSGNTSIALGYHAWAQTRGTSNTALAVGDGSGTTSTQTLNTGPWVFADGINSVAVGRGDGTYADAVGIDNAALALAPGALAIAGKPNFTSAIPFVVYNPNDPNYPNNLSKNNTAIATRPNAGAGAHTITNNITAINANATANGFSPPPGSVFVG